MKYLTAAFLIVALLGGCKQAGQDVGGKIVVRSPYADQQTNITATITAVESVAACRDLLKTGREVGKPYPSLAPLCRFELYGADNTKQVYDLCPYDTGPSILVWHNSKMVAVSVDELKSWCQKSNLDFDKNMKLPNQ